MPTVGEFIELLEDLLSITEPQKDTMPHEDRERWDEISVFVADIREELDGLKED